MEFLILSYLEVQLLYSSRLIVSSSVGLNLHLLKHITRLGIPSTLVQSRPARPQR